jgi:hypothetical protein
VSFSYDSAPQTGALRQGEIITKFWEYQAAAVGAPEANEVSFQPIFHPILVVLSPDCDLEWDFEARQRQREGESHPWEALSHPKVIPHIIACDGFEKSSVQTRSGMNSGITRQISKNSDERYHCFPEASPLPDMILDFKQAQGFPTHLVYESIRLGNTERSAKVPEPYLYDLMHRFYGFLSRIGVPSLTG